MAGLDFPPNQKRAVLAIAAVAAIAFSTVLTRNAMRPNTDVVLHEPGSVIATDSDPLGGAQANKSEVIVHVAGAVRCPNVYKLSSEKRVIDAINAAGGATPDADLQALNLAARVQDGSQIMVPRMGGSQSATTVNSTTPAQVASAAIAASSGAKTSGDKLQAPGQGTVSINSASLEELQRLPGVGPATAQKIMDYRQQLGRFSRAEQLMDVSGIGPKKFEKMRPFVTL